MPDMFSIKENGLRESDKQRLVSLGFKKVDGGYIINLYDLGKKKKRNVSSQGNRYEKLSRKEVMQFEQVIA